MAVQKKVATDVRFRLTPSGQRALDHNERCDCTVVLAGLFAQCSQCGTVYGHVKQMFAPISTRHQRNYRS